MALLAEELVEEWLRRSGHFTIRGIKLGVQEIDLPAVKVHGGDVVARHIEVQASVRPMNYLTPLTKTIQVERGLRPRAAITRTEEEMHSCVAAWVHGEFDHPNKAALRHALVPGVSWSRELVLHRLKDEAEATILATHVTVHRLSDIVAEFGLGTPPIGAAGGADFVDLVTLMPSVKATVSQIG